MSKSTYRQNIRCLLTALLIYIAGVSAATAQSLYLQNFEALAGHETNVQVYLDGADGVVGAQFDITLPYARSSTAATLESSRINGHTMSLRKLSNTRYTVVIMSFANNSLTGSDGVLLNIPVTVTATDQIGDTKPMSLENIVLTSLTGDNVATAATSSATFTVQYEDTPDIVPTDLTIGGSTLIPLGKLAVSFKVKNQGPAQTRAGWTEKVYLKDAAGTKKEIKSQAYPNTLGAGEEVTRNYELDIPKTLGFSGEVWGEVELVVTTSTGEQVVNQANNTTTSTNSCTLEKRLFLGDGVTRILLKEGESKSLSVCRSGSDAQAETFTVAEDNPNGDMTLLTLDKSSVTLNKNNQSIKITATDDDVVNDPDKGRTYVVISGNDYPPLVLTVDVDDNDSQALTLTLDKSTYNEGDDVTLTATIGSAIDSDLKVDISNTASSLFYPYVRSITIPAGQTSASATTQVVDDNYPMADSEVTFTATATGYQTSRKTVTVKDNDWPTLTLTLNPNVISESDGYGATTAIISREGNTAENLIVYLWASDNELYFDSQKNVIPAGQRTIEVPISVKDNSVVNTEAQRTRTISAAPCDAQTGSYTNANAVAKTVTATLTVTDNETSADKALKLQCTTATLAEGGSGTTVTISRNSTEGALTVTLSRDDSRLTIPATVTIPSGSQTATFTVSATKNSTTGDESYGNLTATAEGYQTASFVFFISDQSKPDAVTAAPVITTTGNYYSGQTISGTVQVTNQGLGSMEAGMEVGIYLSTDQSIRVSSYYTSPMQKLATVYTQGEIAIDGSETVNFEVTLPTNQIGVYYLFAWANPGSKEDFGELNSYNGRSTTSGLNIRAPFALTTLTTDKTSYTQGETVSIDGQMSNAGSGQTMEGRTVEVYVIGSGNTLTNVLNVQLDADGNFSTSYELNAQSGGNYGIGARVQGSTDTQTTALITVSGLKIDTGYMKLTMVENEAIEGDIDVTNLSPSLTLTNVKLTMNDLPEEWTVTTTPISSLTGGASGKLHYRIVPTTPTVSSKYIRTAYTVSATMSAASVSKQATMDYYCKAATCNLVTSGDDGIKTTFSKTAPRTWKLTVQNTGSVETGTISVDCPSDQAWLTATTATLASLPSGGQAELTLNMTGSNDMLVDGTYKSYVKLKPQNGTGIVVNVEATLVSSATGTLTVDVVDAFTLAADNGPHVAGAEVRLTNSVTKEVVKSGTTNDDGLFTVNDLQEGTYYVYATADNHYYAEKTITVNPGQDNPLEVFLPYKAVKVTYTVEETTVVDEYRTVLSMEVVPNIPQAIVVPTLPDCWGCGTNTYSIRLTNKGRLTAYNPYLIFPTIDGYTFTVKSAYPETLMPDESYDVTVEYVGPEDKEYGSGIGGIVMNYGYKLRDEMYYGSETYAALVGCSDMPLIFPGGGLANDTNLPNYGGADVADPRLDGIGEELDETGTTQMPTITYRDYTNTQTSSVTLQFEQRFFLERQAFKGHLTVENLQMNGIENITLVPNVKRTDGTDATDLFAISQNGLGSWKNTDEWTLASSKTGEAEVLYVPSKETAPTTKTEYLFGGTLTYRDVETHKVITVELMQTKLTVNPSPDLHLTYFVQRDFIGDDPTTTDVVEPWEPAEFALLIQNKGAGEAINLDIETSEPQIVDNQANLPVTFTKLYTTVDGKAEQFNFNKLSLGSIPAGKNIMARWWFYSNVSAHVASYDVQMTKHSNYGVEFDLITLDGVRELTRSVKGTIGSGSSSSRRRALSTTPDASTNIFLLNLDTTDDLPDYVQDENGNGTDDLQIVSQNSSTTKNSDTEYTLNVTATKAGWVYGAITDPTGGAMMLTSAVRNSDGADVTTNVWQTSRTVDRSNNSTTTEARLHFADNIGTSESYTLTFDTKLAAPEVTSIVLNPAGNQTEAMATKATVTFAEAIVPTTFDADDVVLMANDTQKSVSVSPVGTDGTTFTIDWKNSGSTIGETSLTVYTSGITNTQGSVGTTNKTKTWVAEVMMGDTNCDGSVDVLDVVTLVNHIIGKNPSPFNEAAADMNGDNAIDVLDVVKLVNRIIGKE